MNKDGILELPEGTTTWISEFVILERKDQPGEIR